MALVVPCGSSDKLPSLITQHFLQLTRQTWREQGDGTDRKGFLTTSFHKDRQPDFSKVIPQQAYAHIPLSRQGRLIYLIEADYPKKYH